MNIVCLEKVIDKANHFDAALIRMKLIYCKSRCTKIRKENDKQVVVNHLKSKPSKKRLFQISNKDSSIKRRKSEESDIDLDYAASLISEVSEWRVVLENWNVVTEDLSLNYSKSRGGRRMAV
jgi:hypothetical protein